MLEKIKRTKPLRSEADGERWANQRMRADDKRHRDTERQQHRERKHVA